MDAVEVARQHAEALHAAAVAEGVDPWRPYDLAVAVARGLELDVERVKPDSVGLKGGRAVFDPKGRAIQHEATENLFHEAFLVGHELGHASLGDDQVEDVVETIDPARPAEAAPTGEERVVDYNRRQRREVQMDLFSRELLMPRPWLRALHLDGMSASTVAERLGAPFEAVAQQMLDALLLPVVVRGEAEPKPEKPLNTAQSAAASHFGSPYLLEAGPGTGKTQTLVGRTRFLVEEKQVDPRHILVLTYSNKAAGELSDRIAALRPDAAAAMFIGTFHAFGLDLVRRFHAELGFARPPRMMDRPEAVELLEAEFTRLDLAHYRNLWDPSQLLRDLLGAMSRAQDELVGPARYAELATDMAATATSAAEVEAAARAAEVAKVYTAYEAIKVKAGAVDFGDLVSLPVKLLTSRPDIAAHLCETYQHVLVDEYQDVNRASVRLLQLLTDKGQHLWAVGDARQSIYRFRGASSFNMARFKSVDFPGAGGNRLEVNYRSTKEIVDAYSAFGKGMIAGTGPAHLHAERGPSSVLPSHVLFPTGDDEASTLAAVVREVQADRGAWRDQAILCKGNERLARLGEALERAGIPVLFLGSLFERPEIKDLLAWLSLLVDKRAMGLARRRAAGTDAPLADVAALLTHLKSADASLAWLDPMDLPPLSAQGAAAITQMATLLAGFDRNAAPWDVLSRLLLDRTRVVADIAAADDVASRARGLAIWQFMNFVREQKPEAGLPIQRLLERIRRLVLLADDRELRQLPLAAQEIDAVRLMTVHGSKGLEFPVVHLLGLNKNAFPRSGGPPPACPPPVGLIEGALGSGRDIVTASEAEEQECLFYVALSRARDRLFLYSAETTTNGARRDPSPYLERLGPLQARRLAPAPNEPDDDAAPIAVIFAGPLSFTDAQIALYEKCPRRFFYTHILEVGGRRTTTAFMGLHDVVQATVKILAAQPPEDADDAVVVEIFTSLFDSHEVAGHGYAADFRAIGTQLVGYFADRRRGKHSIVPKPLRLAVAGGEIVVTPDEILVDERGHAVRSIRSGHLSSSQRDNLSAAAFQLAAQDAFPGCRVELVHLADGSETPLALTPKKLATRRARVDAAMADISAGLFPMNESPFTCPRCPAFFICGPVVEGTFEKKS